MVKGILPASEHPELCPLAALKAWRQLLRLHCPRPHCYATILWDVSRTTNPTFGRRSFP
jgi:hypothetical protein